MTRHTACPKSSAGTIAWMRVPLASVTVADTVVSAPPSRQVRLTAGSRKERPEITTSIGSELGTLGGLTLVMTGPAPP